MSWPRQQRQRSALRRPNPIALFYPFPQPLLQQMVHKNLKTFENPTCLVPEKMRRKSLSLVISVT